ncbi:hypothetical protein ACFOJE_19090 [Azotobacter bryophylli]|jgi:hypothetical protein|uniref:Uncharacterized protein n=1 Tax=Azotobacter bryophylli TaxID=1986537 RepID=A0ABV7B0I9_9GAMM
MRSMAFHGPRIARGAFSRSQKRGEEDLAYSLFRNSLLFLLIFLDESPSCDFQGPTFLASLRLSVDTGEILASMGRRTTYPHTRPKIVPAPTTENKSLQINWLNHKNQVRGDTPSG